MLIHINARACRPDCTSPCSGDVRRHRGGCRCYPRRLPAARRVRSCGRAAPAVPRHHRQRAGAGVRTLHRQLEAAAATEDAETAAVTASALMGLDVEAGAVRTVWRRAPAVEVAGGRASMSAAAPQVGRVASPNAHRRPRHHRPCPALAAPDASERSPGRVADHSAIRVVTPGRATGDSRRSSWFCSCLPWA